MEIIVPQSVELLFEEPTIAGLVVRKIDFDYYVLEYGQHGYLQRLVTGGEAEFVEIKQANFCDPRFVPGPLCKFKTLHGRRSYGTALSQSPRAVYLLKHMLRYNVLCGPWRRERNKDLPVLEVVRGGLNERFLSGEEITIDLSENG